jgi:hypothetical protein
MEKKLPENLQQVCQGWEDGPIRLMFQDEARFGRINDVRQSWAPQPIRPVCKAMLTHEYTYAYAAVEPATGAMDTLILPQVNTCCMQLFLDLVGERHPHEHIVMVLDGAGWHSSKKLRPPPHMRLLALPPYSPELNPVEHLWDELREKCFHNKVFASIGALEDDLAMGLLAMENTPALAQSISSWPWIIDGLLKWK